MKTLLISILLLLSQGCAATIQCPNGTFPTTASSEQDTCVEGSVSVPLMSGSVNVGNESKSTWKCAKLCPRGWAWGGTGCVQGSPPAVPAPQSKSPLPLH